MLTLSPGLTADTQVRIDACERAIAQFQASGSRESIEWAIGALAHHIRIAVAEIERRQQAEEAAARLKDAGEGQAATSKAAQRKLQALALLGKLQRESPGETMEVYVTKICEVMEKSRATVYGYLKTTSRKPKRADSGEAFDNGLNLRRKRRT
jgi:hypothetical protein